MKRLYKGILTAAVVIAAVYFLPLVVVESEDSDGLTWRVPVGSWFTEKTDDELTYSSIRSGYALNRDGANALHSYEENKCYGTTYYYDENNDVSFDRYQVRSTFPAVITFHYVKGNACEGWTVDDEVAWAVGSLKDVDPKISTEAAMEQEWLVIVDGKAQNPAVYNDFSRLVKQGVFSVLRTMIVEGSEVSFVDIQLLENARFKVTTWHNGETEEKIYTRFSETELDSGKKVSVYEGSFDHEEETALFEYRV